MAVHTVVTGIGPRSGKPLDRYGAFPAVIIVRAYLVPLFKPVKFICDFRPKSIGVRNTPIVHRLVLIVVF